jgi:uncharacterized phage-like protein YoqJ
VRLAVTGHRPPKVGGYRTPNTVYNEIREVIRTHLIELRPELLFSGMALGIDQWTAELCHEMQIPFVAAVPFNGFEMRWPERSRDHFRYLCGLAQQVHVVTPTTAYRANLLYRRNAWMVDNSDALLAIWNGSDGGTGNTVQYARSRGKQVILARVPIEVWDLARQLETRAATNPPRPWDQALLNQYTNLPARREDRYDNPREIVERAIRERLNGFVGQRNTPETVRAIQASVQDTVNSLRELGVLSRNDIVGVDVSNGTDSSAISIVRAGEGGPTTFVVDEVADAPDPTLLMNILAPTRERESKQEEPLPEIRRRFNPGRKIDIDD